MLALKLAFRNLIGARLRTWLNVFVLSLAFVVIIWFKGVLNGWNEQARRDTIAWQIGGGQYWQENYDPYDPFTIDDSHAPLSDLALKAVEQGKMAPMLISQANMYPQGRIQSISLRGVDPNQNIIELPAIHLKSDDGD
ncbi:MAG: ABC transporter permease, partial [Candidatus Neomarinimicrobiota bacterium]